MHDEVRPGPEGCRLEFVLVHGIGVASTYFERLAPRLARLGDVHTVELPGYGRTPKRQRLVTVEGLAEMLAEAIAGGSAARDPGTEPVRVLVGHSMGAQTVAELARRHSALVDGVVMIGPVTEPRARSPLASAARLGLDTLREPPGANAAVFLDYARFGVRRYLATLPAMLSYRLEDVVPLLDMPLLVVRGERDPIAGPEWSRLLARRAADGIVVEIAGAPHVVMHARPDATARVLGDWATRLTPRGVDAPRVR